ncbi:MAG: mannose-6-phosphate isomerase-like protein (cupin superfamily) [Parvicella sp.]|jgi:mannose-6-phosphate isomerase-like protein (cupin superfamily)
MAEKIFEYLENLPDDLTSHLVGFKKVFLHDLDTQTALTQFAHGILSSGERSSSHVHPTMMECFYFIKGNGEYCVDNKIVDIKPGTFVRIPPNTIHELINSGDSVLEFIYFGIAQSAS